MGGWRRAAIGAAVGALIVLLLHPVSRAYYRTALLLFGPSVALESTPYLPENLGLPPQPTTLLDSAYWVQIAAEREAAGDTLSRRDLEKLLVVVRRARRMSTEASANAFWHQAESIFLLRLGDTRGATEAWIRASRQSGWNDYQNLRLEQIRASLAAESGGVVGWHWGYSYFQRSETFAAAVKAQADFMIGRAPIDSRTGLRLRHATLVNGHRLVEGARSVSTGKTGIEIVESATQQLGSPLPAQPRRLILARADYYNRLRNAGMQSEANQALNVFNANDAWFALSRSEDARRNAERLTSWSLLACVLPGASLLIALFGSVVAYVGGAMERSARVQALLRVPVVATIGLGLAIVVYSATQLGFAALWIAICFSLFAFAPERVRTQPPEELGPMFRFTLIVLGTAFFALGIGIVGGLSSAGHSLWTELDVPQSYGPASPVLIALVVFVLLLVMLMGPIWAFAQRLPTPRVLGQALREFGMGLAVVSLCVSVVGGPLAIYADRWISESLSEIARNEPNHYFGRHR